MKHQRPIWILIRRCLPKQLLADLLVDAEGKWGNATYADGSKREGPRVHFSDHAPSLEVFKHLAEQIAPILRISIDPKRLTTIQLSEWPKGAGYGIHSDYGEDVEQRKMSIWTPIKGRGDLKVRNDSFDMNEGDVLAFSALELHSKPVNNENALRYSAVAWIEGEDWT